MDFAGGKQTPLAGVCLDEVIKNEPEIIRLLRQNDPLFLDNGDGRDIHELIEEDPKLKLEFMNILKEFYGEESSEEPKSSLNAKAVFQDEDKDDMYDKSEHEAKTKRLLSQTITRADEIIPPENFSHVLGEIYRSSFPRVENFSFLSQRLHLKSILVLIPEEYPQENADFLKEADIKLFKVGMSGNKEPFVNIPSDLLTKALEIVLNPENQPILIHCNRGKHRTGCLIGCIRKLQSWSLTMIFDEYRRFAFPKARALDQQFIEMYDDNQIRKVATEKAWLPLEW